MSVKERILSIKLMNRKKTSPDFINEIGVTTAWVVNNDNKYLISSNKKGAKNENN